MRHRACARVGPLGRGATRPVNELPELLPETERFLARAPAERRKRLGQFFTPASIRHALLEGMQLPARASILDPACGTGEFLHSARRLWPKARLVGWEIDPELRAIAASQVPDAEVQLADALLQPVTPAFDAVVGNPPYFELRPDASLRLRFAPAISGRPNTYAMFLQLGVEMLREGGQLAYVVPPSMNNGAYFAGLRRYLVERCRVESIRLLEAADLFEGAQQTVMLLRLRRGDGGLDRPPHVFRRGPFVLFAQDPSQLERLFEHATTLAALGYTVRTGSVVWNQARDRLTEDPAGATRLIWAHNIAADRLEWTPRRGKPGFVRGVDSLIGPAIVVNRITGVGPRATLRVATVPEGMPFVGENHVNVVLPPQGLFSSSSDLETVASALRSAHAREGARRLTGNTQISRTELAHLIPLRL
jgi:adenine-specific DNA-methyltransferase